MQKNKILWKLVVKFVSIFTLIWFVSGIVRFPDSPIQACGENNYCGKQGQHRSKEDFENFKLWETVNLIAFPTVFLLLILDRKVSKK